MEIVKSKMANALTSADSNHIIAVANDVYDDNKKKYQSEINTKLMEGKRYDSENNTWVDNKAQVENSLNSTSTEIALSAAQGKKLNDSITTLSTNLEAAQNSLSEQISTSADTITAAYTKAISDLTESMEVGTDENNEPKKATIANAIQYALDEAIYTLLDTPM